MSVRSPYRGSRVLFCEQIFVEQSPAGGRRWAGRRAELSYFVNHVCLFDSLGYFVFAQNRKFNCIQNKRPRDSATTLDRGRVVGTMRLFHVALCKPLAC